MYLQLVFPACSPPPGQESFAGNVLGMGLVLRVTPQGMAALLSWAACAGTAAARDGARGQLETEGGRQKELVLWSVWVRASVSWQENQVESSFPNRLWGVGVLG